MAEIIYLEKCATHEVLGGASCAFGVFDGVHLGHKYLIEQARGSAARDDGQSVILTFSIDPDELFAADRLVKLMSNEERILALSESGVDAVVVLPFNKEFASLLPEEFLERTFGDYVPAYMHVGEGFRFGFKGSGDVARLREWGELHGMVVRCHDLFKAGGAPVSSTRIRGLLAEGKIREAEDLLIGSLKSMHGKSRSNARLM